MNSLNGIAKSQCSQWLRIPTDMQSVEDRAEGHVAEGPRFRPRARARNGMEWRRGHPKTENAVLHGEPNGTRRHSNDNPSLAFGERKLRSVTPSLTRELSVPITSLAAVVAEIPSRPLRGARQSHTAPISLLPPGSFLLQLCIPIDHKRERRRAGVHKILHREELLTVRCNVVNISRHLTETTQCKKAAHSTHAKILRTYRYLRSYHFGF